MNYKEGNENASITVDISDPQSEKQMLILSRLAFDYEGLVQLPNFNNPYSTGKYTYTIKHFKNVKAMHLNRLKKVRRESVVSCATLFFAFISAFIGLIALFQN